MAHKEILPLTDTERKIVERFNSGIPILWIMALLASAIGGFIQLSKNGYFDWWFSSIFFLCSTLFLAYVGWRHYKALSEGVKVRLSGRITSLEHDKSRFFYVQLDQKFKIVVSKEDYQSLQINDNVAVNFIPNTETEEKTDYTDGKIDLSIEKPDGNTGTEPDKKSA